MSAITAPEYSSALSVTYTRARDIFKKGGMPIQNKHITLLLHRVA